MTKIEESAEWLCKFNGKSGNRVYWKILFELLLITKNSYLWKELCNLNVIVRSDFNKFTLNNLTVEIFMKAYNNCNIISRQYNKKARRKKQHAKKPPIPPIEFVFYNGKPLTRAEYKEEIENL